MRLARSWAFRTFAFPAVVLLGAANMGCPGSTTKDNSGGGGSGASGGSTSEGGGGDGGGGGSTCSPEAEICDTKDNDCDGVVDNVDGGCDCTVGEQQPCYSGPAGTVGVGACLEGVQECKDGKWDVCLNEVVPTPETCNLLDDDCNTFVDDMGMLECGVGACAASVEACVAGSLQSCVPGQPSLETCDGVDNNCNQLTDESDPMTGTVCDSGMPGACAAGKLACTGMTLVCAPNALPVPESCDGVDNDCNGTVDDGIPGTGGMCSTGAMGVCAAGTISCKQSAGIYQVDCFSNVEQSPEICDGLDNDCDGTVDDGNPEGGGACDTGQLGLCQAGTFNCVAGALMCTPNALASTEVCDGIDNNCDGQIDEGNPGGNVACGCGGAGITACTNGAIVCNGGPITYFSEDFSDNTAGWTVGPNWSIGPTVSSPTNTSCGGGDPATDHTAGTADNGVAGNVLGGNVSQTVGGPYYLTSPVINTAAAPAVFLEFWRWLHSDYPNFMIDKIEVSTNGQAWTQIWINPSGTVVNDTAWTKQSFDITAYKSATMQVRWSYQVGSTGAFLCAGWNIDDVLITSAACP